MSGIKTVMRGQRKPSVNWNTEQHKLSNLNKREKNRLRLKVRNKKKKKRIQEPVKL